MSHFYDGVVSIFNTNDGKLITKLEIEQPNHSTSDLNKIYIVSEAHVVGVRDKRKFIKIKKGNYINIISKSNLQIINKIQFDNWFFPFSIYLSNDGNIYTTAYELDNNKIWSGNRFLFQINKSDNQIINKIELNDIHRFYDVLYLNNKIILCAVNEKENEMRIIEFY